MHASMSYLYFGLAVPTVPRDVRMEFICLGVGLRHCFRARRV